MQLAFSFTSDSIPADAAPDLEAIATAQRDAAWREIDECAGCEDFCDSCESRLAGVWAAGGMP